MNKSITLFLIRYWLLCISIPSILLGSGPFFWYSSDHLWKFNPSGFWYELTNYLFPSIGTFMLLGYLLAFFIFWIDYWIMISLYKKIPIIGLKCIFFVINSCLFLAPFVIWEWSGQTLSGSILMMVVPTFITFIFIFSLGLINQKKIDDMIAN